MQIKAQARTVPSRTPLYGEGRLGAKQRRDAPNMEVIIYFFREKKYPSGYLSVILGRNFKIILSPT